MDDQQLHLNQKANQYDPLLECLVILTRIYGKPTAKESLVAGLPLVESRLTPTLFERAAERANLSTRILATELDEIHPLTLPNILLLKNNQACILTKIEHEIAEIILPETGKGSSNVPLEHLAKEYLGYTIYAKPNYRFEQRADEYKIDRPASWFWSTILRFRENYRKTIVGTLLINIFALTGSLFSMNVYDRVVPNNATDTLWVLAIGVSVIYIFDFAMRMLRTYLIDFSGKKSDLLLASMLFQHAMNIKMENRPKSVGSFSSLFQSYEQLREFFTSATLSGLVDLPFALLFLVVIATVGGWLVMAPLVTFPLIILITWWIEKKTKHHVEIVQSGSMQKNALLIETLSNLETVKTTGAQGVLQGRWERFLSMTSGAAIMSKLYGNLGANISNLLIQLESVAMIILGVYAIKAGTLSMGGLIACNILASRCLAPAAQLANLLTRYQLSVIGLESLNVFMALPEERSEQKNYVFRKDLAGSLEFKDVNFAYPNTRHHALTNISFAIRENERVGIIGRIGSGKSTLQKLMLSLYSPQSGQILIDGTDISQIDPAVLRRHIGYVGQDSALFYGTIRDNIMSSAPWSDDESLLQVAKAAGVDKFIAAHPAGYDMPVGERGEMISGGQRQSVMLARALLPDPKILLFDEPTSAMDTLAEREFIRSMAEYGKNKTMIVITHRLSLLQLVDRVIIMDSGKVVADGRKDTILEAFNLNRSKNTEDV